MDPSRVRRTAVEFGRTLEPTHHATQVSFLSTSANILFGNHVIQGAGED